MPAPDLYTYLDYRAYLSDWFDARKAANPRFSHRAFARKAAQRSPSLLLHVIDRKRNLTPTTLEGFARAVGLKGDDLAYFAALVQLDQGDTPDERNRAWEFVRATRRFREARQLEGDGFAYLSHWRHPAIRELASCAGFRPDAEWIAQTLRPAVSVEEAGESLDLLFRLGLLVREPDGTVRPCDVSVVTPHEVAGLAALNYHRGMLERAREALATTPAAERHFCAVTVAIPDAMLPALRPTRPSTRKETTVRS
jgi:uncharacterized protein (TIGR02147 family)